jgi:actin-like ATPase involved in cell morphogenesis
MSNISPGIGLDVGTGFCVSARQLDNQFIFKSFRDAFIKVDNTTDLTKKLISEQNTNHITKDNNLYIIGEEAISFANLLNKEVRRPLAAGVISSEEKEAGEILELILQGVAGPPQTPGETLYYSVPAKSLDVDNDIVFHQMMLEQIFTDMGYNAKPLNEALAVAYSNLASDGMTGLSISFGSGMTNACLSLSAVSLVEFSVARGGDWIDGLAAKATGLTSTRARTIKEKGIDLTLARQATKEENAIAIYYKNLIQHVIDNFKKEFEKNNITQGFDKPIKVVLAGGTSLPKGFDTLFEQLLRKSNFPLNVSAVVRAGDPLNDIAKGLLLAALSD